VLYLTSEERHTTELDAGTPGICRLGLSLLGAHYEQKRTGAQAQAEYKAKLARCEAGHNQCRYRDVENDPADTGQKLFYRPFSVADLFAADRANLLIFGKQAVAFEAALQVYPPPLLSTDDRRTNTERNSKKYTPDDSRGTPRHVAHGTSSALGAGAGTSWSYLVQDHDS
jgi:hypothetical protein